jgi:integrase
MGGARKVSGVEARETSIRVTFTLEGKQQRKTLMVNGEPMKPTPANIKYAERVAAEIRDRIRYGTFSMAEYFPASGSGATVMTLAEWLPSWLAAQRLTPSTRKGYNGCINFWKKELGETPLRALKKSHILSALAKHPKLSGKTVNNRVSVLREALDLAVDDKLLTENPAATVRRAAYQKPAPDPFSAEEVELILSDMLKHYDAQVANYVEAKFFTGLRTGESFGLRWPNVDLNSNEILVCESVVEGEEQDRTKTDTVRRVFLNSRARAAFVRQRKHTAVKGGHVFHDPRYHERWSAEQTFRYFWTPTLKRLKIRHRPPYNTRHTYATMMLMAGMTPAFCAGQMGHSVEMFLRTYAKWIPGVGDKAEMAKLEQRLTATGTK